MNLNLKFLLSLKINKILKGKNPFTLNYFHASDSSKSPKTIKINIVRKGEKFSKIADNTTNKIFFGPVIKKPVNAKEKDKELTKKPLVSRLIKKKYSNTLLTDNVTNINVNEYQNLENTKMENILEFSSGSQNIDYPDRLTASQTNDSIEEITMTNPSKKTQRLSSSDDFIYNISIFEGGYKKLPSVTNILRDTMPEERKFILKRWEQNMILKLGEEGFKNYQQALFDRGKIFHECVEMRLRNEEVKEEQLVGVERFWTSIKETLPNISNVRVLESRVIHSHLQYQGCIDCLGFYRNVPVVIEFKTSTKPKLNISSTYDNPLQMAAYIGALNHDPTYNSLPNITEALLVIAYETGLPAHVHFLSKEKCQKYWTFWYKRFVQFQSMKAQNSL